MPVIQLPASGWRERPYQRKLWSYLQSGGKRAIEIAHRRWGKDDVALHHTAISAHERVASYWHCLPEFSQARKAVWTAVNPHTGRRRIDEAFPLDLRATTNDNEMFIRFKNGSTWQVIGSDRYDGLVGSGVAGVVFSEWALANPSSWGYIRPMVEENNGWAAFITTPRGRNHAKSMFDMAKANPKWFAELSTIHDTEALSPEQIKESLDEYVALYGEDIGQAQFEQEYLCSFNAAILGAFYAREMAAVRRDGRIAAIEPVPGKPVHTAWDIGVRDDTSIWWFQVVGGRILILDCYTASGAGVDHYAEICHSKPWPRGNDYVPHDAKVKEWGTGRTRVETMQALRLKPVLAPTAGKLDGIQAARTTLPRCIFHPRTDIGISALEQYRREWDDEKKTFKPSEVHDWCFTADTEVLTRYGTYPIKGLPNQGEVLTPCGWKPYHSPRMTRRDAQLVEVRFVGGHTVRCTPDHMFATACGWKSAQSLTRGTLIRSSLTHSRSISMAAFIAYGRAKSIIHEGAKNFIALFGRGLLARSLTGAISTIGILIPRITPSKTWSAFPQGNIFHSLGRVGETGAPRADISHKPLEMLPLTGISQKRGGFGIAGTPNVLRVGPSGSARTASAIIARLFSRLSSVRAGIARGFAVLNAKYLRIDCVSALNTREDVYCITVPGEEAFSLANGAVVHNCSHLADAFRYLSLAWRTSVEVFEEPKIILPPGYIPPPPVEMPQGNRIKL